MGTELFIPQQPGGDAPANRFSRSELANLKKMAGKTGGTISPKAVAGFMHEVLSPVQKELEALQETVNQLTGSDAAKMALMADSMRLDAQVKFESAQNQLRGWLDSIGEE